MDLGKLASQLFANKLGANCDQNQAASALNGLIGGGDSIDLGGIVQQLQGRGGDLANMAKSWLGDGDNLPISPSQVSELLGSDKVRGFAEKMGLDQQQVEGGLADMLPNLIDKSSRGGNLLDAVGGLGGLKGLASKFLK